MGSHVFQDPLKRLRARDGKINLLTILIILVVVGLIWAAFTFVPAWVDHYKFEEKLRAAANMAHRVKDDEVLMKEIRRELKILGMDLPYDAVQTKWDARGEFIEIHARYNRVVELVPFGLEVTLEFTSDIVERF